MQKIYGVTGPARSGKDTFIKFVLSFIRGKMFAFSDILYTEVAEAFNTTETILRADSTKDSVHPTLTLGHCSNKEFVQFMQSSDLGDSVCLSPRFVLQYWGDFRRAQNPLYLINFVHHQILHAHQMERIILISGVRDAKEVYLINGLGGSMIHIENPSAKSVNQHKIETPLPFLEGDIKFRNTSSLLAFKLKAFLFALKHWIVY